MKTTDPYMIRTLELAAKAGLGERSGGCFGAVVVRSTDGQIVGEGYNRVLTKCDPTCHGEMEAIRAACAYLHTHVLKDCVLYTSSEPCPMCMCAAGWARIPKIVYASTIEDARDYGGFDDVSFYKDVTNKTVATMVRDDYAREDMVEMWNKYRESQPVLY